MIKGKTPSGFEFEVDDDVLYDAEFLELFTAVRKGGEGSMEVFALAENALGPEQKKRLYDHVRGDGKRVPVAKLSSELSEIFSILGDHEKTKN